jgi:hypothetical protein
MLSQLLPTIFQPLAEASGGDLKVDDIAPLAPGDANGIGLMFYMLVCCLLGFMTANIVGNAAFFLRMPQRLMISAGIAVLAPSVLWLLMGAWMHVLQGSPGQIIASIAVGATASFTVALVVHAMVVFLGKWAIFPSIFLFVFMNIPSSNSAYPMEFVPAPFGWVSHIHLGAAMVNTVRSILYLHGDGIGRGLRVMAVWFVVGVVLMVLALWRRRHKARIEAAEDAAERAREAELAEQRDEAAAATVGASPAAPALLGIVRTSTGVPVPGGQVVMLDADGRETGVLGVGEDGRFSFGKHARGHHAGPSEAGGLSSGTASAAHAGSPDATSTETAQTGTTSTDATSTSAASGAQEDDTSWARPGTTDAHRDGAHGVAGTGQEPAPGAERHASTFTDRPADGPGRRHGRHEARTDDGAAVAADGPRGSSTTGED